MCMPGSRRDPNRDVVAHPLADDAHLAQTSGEEGDDAVGLPQLLGSQDDGLVAVEGTAPLSAQSAEIRGRELERPSSIASRIRRATSSGVRPTGQPGVRPGERAAESPVSVMRVEGRTPRTMPERRRSPGPASASPLP